ncbi:MAG: hypothetical protein JW891_18470 [Candidatus Lokiarchaeota archaeon]|nr:hypothetical protein [Candidatus Lokiarchaeota archaeon]
MTEGKVENIKNLTAYLTRHLKVISREPRSMYFPAFNDQLDMELLHFNYGGSFDRHTLIRKHYDVDAYLVYVEKGYAGNFVSNRVNRGSQLFVMLRTHLDILKNRYNVDMEILKDFPYAHAIPIRIYFNDSQSSDFDCIPAIKYNNDVLRVPNGMNDLKFVNPNLDLRALSAINKLRNGKATKLILLLKYWNIHWGKPLKSYVIERLVEQIFLKSKINDWKNGLKTFFNQATFIIGNEILIPDKIYPNRSILDDYSKGVLNEFYNTLKKASGHATREEWRTLFGNF